MNNIKIKKDELLAILRANRENHRKIFLEAQDGFRQAAIAELEKSLESARSGKRVRTIITLQEPSDQTKDYDRVIRMLELTTQEEIDLSERDFSQYVLDDWSWKHQFLASNAAYSSTAMNLMDSAE